MENSSEKSIEYSDDDNLEEIWRTYEHSLGYKVLHNVQEGGNWGQYEKKNPLMFEDFNKQFNIKIGIGGVLIGSTESPDKGKKPIF